MKVNNDTSILFVKQDLFANKSPSKASNITGSELNSKLIADINKNDSEHLDESYQVDFTATPVKSATEGKTYVIKWDPNSDYLACKELATKEGTARSIETSIQQVFRDKYSNLGAVTAGLVDVTRALNTYVYCSNGVDDLKNDSYLRSLTERFDQLDPNGKDPMITQLRSMVQQAQQGITVHVTDDKYITNINQVAESFAVPPPQVWEYSDLTLVMEKQKQEQAEKNFLQQSFEISIMNIENEADTLNKLLDDDSDSDTADDTDEQYAQKPVSEIANIDSQAAGSDSKDDVKEIKMKINFSKYEEESFMDFCKRKNEAAIKEYNEKKEQVRARGDISINDWLNTAKEYFTQHKDTGFYDYEAFWEPKHVQQHIDMQA